MSFFEDRWVNGSPDENVLPPSTIECRFQNRYCPWGLYCSLHSAVTIGFLNKQYTICVLVLQWWFIIQNIVLTFSAIPANLRTSARIVGGTVTTINQWPYMANIMVRSGNFFSQFCGGTIINNRSVLSAAHCVRTPDQ